MERVVGAYIESIFRTALAIETDPSNERLVEALEFYRNQERRALEVLATPSQTARLLVFQHPLFDLAVEHQERIRC